MRSPSLATRSPWTWLLAGALYVGANLALPRTDLFWIAPATAAWIPGSIPGQAFVQTYEALQKVEHPRREAAVRVALLGNSRLWFGAPDWVVERELQSLRPGLDIRVDNLAFFGARIGDLEMVSRNLSRSDPQLVVIALGGSELVPTDWSTLVNSTGRSFDVGWAEGPLPSTWHERAGRWLGTAFPLLRMRIFARGAIGHRLFPGPPPQVLPESFASAAEIFAFLYGPLGAQMTERYSEWVESGRLEDFEDYLKVGKRLRSEPLPALEALDAQGPGAAALGALLARLGAEGRRVVVLLMPDNPVLEQDLAGRFSRAGFRDRAAQVIGEVAARERARVVDGAGWLRPEDFLDFHHPLPEVGGLQRPLAQEILRELDI